MKKVLAIALCCGLVTTPLYAGTLRVAGAGAGRAPSLLAAAEIAAASGVYRAQNVAGITTSKIQPGDKKRSAIAYGLSGLMAFAGAALWRWVPCRNREQASNVAGLPIEGYNKCYDGDGVRLPWDTPTKAMFAAGIGFEVVSLIYFISHLRSDDNW